MSSISPVNWVCNPNSVVFINLHSSINGNSSMYGASTSSLFIGVNPVLPNLASFFPDAIPK